MSEDSAEDAAATVKARDVAVDQRECLVQHVLLCALDDSVFQRTGDGKDPSLLDRECRIPIAVLSSVSHESIQDDTGIPVIQPFLFPCGIRLSRHEVEPFFHSFVMVDQFARKSYGFCLTVQVQLTDNELSVVRLQIAAQLMQRPDAERRDLPKVLWAPQTLCIVSPLPLHNMFHRLLCEIPRSLLLQDRSFPPDIGQKVFDSLSPTMCSPTLDARLIFERIDVRIKLPSSSELPLVDLDFAILFSHLEPRNVIILFNAIMCEKRVVIVSSDTSIITPCIEAISALIYPFEWSFSYVPLLPITMIDYLYVPGSLLCGTLMEALSNPPWPDDAVIVDLDNNVITCSENYVELPWQLQWRLFDQITKHFDAYRMTHPGEVIKFPANLPVHAVVKNSQRWRTSTLPRSSVYEVRSESTGIIASLFRSAEKNRAENAPDFVRDLAVPHMISNKSILTLKTANSLVSDSDEELPCSTDEDDCVRIRVNRGTGGGGGGHGMGHGRHHNPSSRVLDKSRSKSDWNVLEVFQDCEERCCCNDDSDDTHCSCGADEGKHGFACDAHDAERLSIHGRRKSSVLVTDRIRMHLNIPKLRRAFLSVMMSLLRDYRQHIRADVLRSAPFSAPLSSSLSSSVVEADTSIASIASVASVATTTITTTHIETATETATETPTETATETATETPTETAEMGEVIKSQGRAQSHLRAEVSTSVSASVSDAYERSVSSRESHFDYFKDQFILFEKKAFLCKLPIVYQEFMKHVLSTQMFQAFIENRITLGSADFYERMMLRRERKRARLRRLHQKTVKRGVMWKIGSGMPTWHLRFFELDGMTLKYSKVSDEVQMLRLKHQKLVAKHRLLPDNVSIAEETARVEALLYEKRELCRKGSVTLVKNQTTVTVPVANYRSSWLPFSQEYKTRWAFVLTVFHTPDMRKVARKIVLCAFSSESRRDWIQLFRARITTHEFPFIHFDIQQDVQQHIGARTRRRIESATETLRISLQTRGMFSRISLE